MNDAAERDDGNVGRSATDVDDHVPARLMDRDAGADRRGPAREVGLGRGRGGGRREGVVGGGGGGDRGRGRACGGRGAEGS